MKNLKVLAAILPLISASCSDEYTGAAALETSNFVNAITKKSGVTPNNTSNPYDFAGEMHNNILADLENTDLNLRSIAFVANAVDSVYSSNSGITSLSSGNPLLSIRLPEIAAMVNNNNLLPSVLATSSMRAPARISLSTFIDSLTLDNDHPYEQIYNQIISYETSILANTNMNISEKRIILTTTSVVRYSVYEKKRKDKDWETSVTSIAATIAGSEECPALAVKMAAVVGLCKNNNIIQ
nr:hypothetical protein [Flavobacterium sp. ASV13]